MSLFHRKTLHPRNLLATMVFSMLPCWSNATENLPLNGIDVYDHMGKDYYWVSHTTEQSCQTAETCQQATTSARFRLKIMTKRWTAQNFNLVWQRELASNNQKLPANFDMQALIDFTQLPKTPLTQGDIIDIAFDGKNTLISINNAIAQRSSGKVLFNYLSNIWIGSVPPSRSFRSNMLQGHGGEHSQETLIAFKTSKIDKSRLGLLKTWQDIKEKSEISSDNNSENKEEIANQNANEIALKLSPSKPEITESSLNSTPIATTQTITKAVDDTRAVSAKISNASKNEDIRSETKNVIEKLTSATSTIPKTAIPTESIIAKEPQ